MNNKSIFAILVFCKTEEITILTILDKKESSLKFYMSPMFSDTVSNLLILGPACSDTVEPIAGVSKHFRTVVISYSAEGMYCQYPIFRHV